MSLEDRLLPLPKRITRKSGTYAVPERFAFHLNVDSAKLAGSVADLARASRCAAQCVAGRRAAVLRLVCRDRLASLQSVRAELAHEGYVLKVDSGGIEIQALSERGLFYGLQTLRQLLGGGRRAPRVRIVDWPDMPFRGVHLTFGGGGYTFEMLSRTIRQLASYKVNTIMFEYDDKFPWQSHPVLVHPETLSRQDLRKLIALAADNCMEVVPLLDSLGHARFYLMHKPYKHLAELPDNIHEMCPNNPGTLNLIKELWTEILDLHPETHYAHITGDEVFRLGRFCPKCRRYANRGELGKLFTEYYTDLSRWIIKQGKIPMVWGDMLVKYWQDIDNFPRDIIINDWCYRGFDAPSWPSTIGNYGNFTHASLKVLDKDVLRTFGKYWIQKSTAPEFTPYPNLKFFQDKGFEVIGCAAASTSRSSIFPFCDPSERYANPKWWGEALAANQAMGMLNTFWGNASLVEASWYGFCAGADFSWHSRREEEDAFSRRFASVFLGAPPAQGRVVPQVGRSVYPRERGLYRVRRGAQRAAHATVRRAGRLRAASVRNKGYAAIAEAAAKAGALDAKVSDLVDRTAALVLGGRPTRAVSIRQTANADFHSCTPPKAATLAVPTGRKKVYGVPFDILDPAQNRGRSVIALRGGKNPGGPTEVRIPVGRADVRVLEFLWTAFDSGPGAHMADMVVHYDKGAPVTVPLVAGRQLADWWSKPVPLTEGFVAWWGGAEQSVRTFCYVAQWRNPRPARRIEAVDLKSTPHEGYLITLGMLTAGARTAKPSAREVRALRREFASVRKQFDKILGVTERAYRKVMSPAAAQRAARQVSVRSMAKWCDACAAQLDRLSG